MFCSSLKEAADLRSDQGGSIALYQNVVLDFDIAEDPAGYQELATLTVFVDVMMLRNQFLLEIIGEMKALDSYLCIKCTVLFSAKYFFSWS